MKLIFKDKTNEYGGCKGNMEKHLKYFKTLKWLMGKTKNMKKKKLNTKLNLKKLQVTVMVGRVEKKELVEQ